MERDNNTKPIIWVTNDVEEYDAPSSEYVEYKDNERLCYLRDVDVFDKRVKNFKEGDYLLLSSSLIQLNGADLWRIERIYKQDEFHKDSVRMLIFDGWTEQLKLNNYKFTNS